MFTQSVRASVQERARARARVVHDSFPCFYLRQPWIFSNLGLLRLHKGALRHHPPPPPRGTPPSLLLLGASTGEQAAGRANGPLGQGTAVCRSVVSSPRAAAVEFPDHLVDATRRGAGGLRVPWSGERAWGGVPVLMLLSVLCGQRHVARGGCFFFSGG